MSIASRRADRRLASLALIVALSACLALLTIGSPKVQILIVANSDTLLPAAYADNLFHHPGTIASFQLPRVPSFVPDLAAYLGLRAILPDWRWAGAAYAVLSYVALVLLAGAVVAEMTGRAWDRGCAAFLAVSAPALLLALELDSTTAATLDLFVPAAHAGSFLLSLAALLLARGLLARPSRAGLAALFTLALLGMASDKLFLGSCMLPLAGSAFIVGRAGGPARLRTVLAASVGCAAGVGADRLLFARWLTRQPDFPIDPIGQLARLPPMLHDPGLWVAAAAAAIVLLVPWHLKPRSRPTVFWSAAAAITAVGFAGLLPLLWENTFATRYAQPIWWWALIVLAAAALHASFRITAAAGALATAALAITIGPARHLAQPDRVLGYRVPLAACLLDLHARGIIHAGIAQYWTARATEAAADWRLQLAQVVAGGEIFVWGNNPADYTHDRTDPAHAPLFDYVVMKDLAPNEIGGRFGEPDRVIPCSGADIWTYATPGGIAPHIGNLGLADARNGVLARSACFGVQDFTTRAGPLRRPGVTIPATAPPHEIAVWGPYAPITAGDWTLDLAYALSSAAPDTWDIAIDLGTHVLARGQLEPTGLALANKLISLHVDRDTTPLELRAALQPGDHFRLASLRITHAGVDAPPCPVDDR